MLVPTSAQPRPAAHARCSLLLENGETEKYVAERLGDTVEMIHETYGHVTPRMRAGAVRRLGALIAGPAADVENQ